MIFSETEDTYEKCWVSVTDFKDTDLLKDRGNDFKNVRGLRVLSPNSPEEIISSDCIAYITMYSIEHHIL